jgi:hypothetical protein
MHREDKDRQKRVKKRRREGAPLLPFLTLFLSSLCLCVSVVQYFLAQFQLVAWTRSSRDGRTTAWACAYAIR